MLDFITSSDGGSADKVKPSFSLPYPVNKNFVGREEELNELHTLLAENKPVAIAAVSGMGGLGKTELAVQYAHQYQSEYDGGLVWLSGRGDVVSNLAEEFILRFGQQKFPVQEGKKLAQWCWNRWQPPEKQVLVVIDDVNKDSLRSVMAALPTENRFRVLVTTRLQKLDPKFEILPLKVLPPDKALELLGKILGEGDSRLSRESEQAEALCKQLGYLPLGLELVRRYLLDDPDLSLAEVLAELQEKGVEAEAIDREEEDLEETAMKAQRGVRAAFELSWEKLKAEAQSLGRLLAVFANEIVPAELLEAVTQELGWSAKALREGRKELYKFSLVERSEELAGGFNLHPLIWRFLQGKLAQAEDAEADRKAFVSVLIARANKIESDITVQELSSLQFVIPHLEAVTKRYLSLVKDEDVACAFAGVAKYYEGQGLYFLAEPWYKKGLEATQERLGKQHLSVASIINDLALLYKKQAQYKQAESLFEEALNIKKELLGEQHHSVAITLNNLASLYISRGKYEEAEPLFLKALAIKRECLGEPNLSVANTLHHIGSLYHHQGKYNDAENYYLQALEMRRQVVGEEHPNIAQSFNNLAGLYYSWGRFDEAESYFIQALEMRRRLLHERHPYVAQSLNDLARVYLAQKRYSEAETLFLEALEIRKEHLGEQHPYVAQSCNELAVLYYAQGRYEEAEPLVDKALKINKQVLGDEHHEVGNCLNTLGKLNEAQKKYEEAKDYYLQALEIYDRALGSDHPHTKIIRSNLEHLPTQKKSSEANALKPKTNFRMRLQWFLEGMGSVLEIMPPPSTRKYRPHLDRENLGSLRDDQQTLDSDSKKSQGNA